MADDDEAQALQSPTPSIQIDDEFPAFTDDADESRDQFRELPGILERGESTTDRIDVVEPQGLVRAGSISRYMASPDLMRSSASTASKTDDSQSDGGAAEGTGLKQFLWRNYVETTKLEDKQTGYGANYALGCLHVHNPVRWRAIRIVTDSRFDLAIIVIILLNCVALAAYDPTAEAGESESNNALDVIEYLFLAAFTIEMSLKIVAYGFVIGPGTYLRDHWNQLDFLIVVSGYLDIIITATSNGGGEGNVRAIRAVRVLRSLRVIHGLPSLARVINSIGAALPRLLYVAYLAVAIVLLYGIMGVTFFGGKLNTACFYNATGERVGERPCTTVGDGYRCLEGQFCKGGVVGPNNGITSFDNIGLAMLTVLQCMSLEGWTDIWYYCNDAVGRELPWLYFVSLVVFGAFLVLNLVLGVISGEFSKEGQRMERRRKHIRHRKKRELREQLENYSWWMDATEDVITDIVQSTQLAALKFSDQALEAKATDDDDDAGTPVDNIPTVDDADRLLWAYRVPWAAAIVKSKYFTLGVMVVVFVNTVFLAIDHAFQSEELADMLRIGNFVFIAIFVTEMAIKVWALGGPQYWSFKFNRFDAVVVIISILEIIAVETLDAQPMGLSVFRSVRLLRLMRFTSYWTVLSELVDQIVEDLASVLSLLGVLQVLILIYALLGMQLFGGRFDSDVRINYDNFWNAYVSVFSILTGENWNEAMYNGINSYGGVQKDGGWASLYFLSLVICGNYVVLNIFLAIAVESLETVQATLGSDFAEDGDGNPEDYLTESFAQKRARRKSTARARSSGVSVHSSNDEDEDEKDAIERGATIRKLGQTESQYRNRHKKSSAADNSTEAAVDDDDASPSNDADSSGDADRRRSSVAEPAAPKYNYVEALSGKNNKEAKRQPLPPYTALGVFSVDNPLRLWLYSVVTHPRFDDVILVFIIVSSLCLAIEDPVNRGASVNEALRYVDFIFTAVFTIEMLMKWIVFGLVLHRGSYMRSGWNLLDMLIVFASLAAIIVTESSGGGSEASSVRVLRLARVLRPLRSIHRIPKLQVVVECLFQSVRNITSIFLLAITFTFFFAIIGVQLMKGSFYRCEPVDPYVPEVDCVGNYTEVDQFGFDFGEPRSWGNAYMNFDTSAQAMQALFAASTTEGWLVTLFNAVDSVGEGLTMQKNHDPGIALFFILYMIVVSFYMTNLFIGFVIVTFADSIEEGYAHDPLDKNDREALGYVLTAKTRKLWRPDESSPFRRKVYGYVESSRFRNFIGGLIIVNLIVLMMYHHNMSEEFTIGLFVANCIFTAIFTIEAALKLYALTPTGYFDDDWNSFDFLIVVGSIVDAALEGDAVNLTFLRLFRTIRIARLMKRGELKRLLYTFIQSFKDLPYVGLLLFLVFFLYGVIGMQVFGRIALHEDMPINRNANFQTFPMALGLLFRCCTGEDWQVVMEGLYIKDTAECNDNDPDGSTCGVKYFNVVYMVSFVLIMSFLVLNLFVAVIIDNFSYLTEDSSTLNVHALYDLVARWPRFDENADGKIHRDSLPLLLRSLDPPLGVGKKCTEIMLYRILSELDVPVDEQGFMKLRPTLFAAYKIRRGNRKKTSKFFVGKKPWVQWPTEEIRLNLLANPRYADTAIHEATPEIEPQTPYINPCPNTEECKPVCVPDCQYREARQKALDDSLKSIQKSSRRYYLMRWCQASLHLSYRNLQHQCAACSRMFKNEKCRTTCPCPWKEWKFDLDQWCRMLSETSTKTVKSWADVGKFGWRESRKRRRPSHHRRRLKSEFMRGAISTLFSGHEHSELELESETKIVDTEETGEAVWLRVVRLDAENREPIKLWNFAKAKHQRVKFEGGRAYVESHGIFASAPELIPDDELRDYERVAFHSVVLKPNDEEVEVGEFIEGAFADGVDQETPLDEWNGQAMLVLPDGSWYQGEFANGQFHGQGTFECVLEPTKRHPYRNGTARYTGSWQNGKKHGQGLLVYPNGSWYYGEWLDGRMEGWGTFYWGEGVYKGSQYRGPWEFGHMQTNDDNGERGVMVFADGRIYSGQWKRGFPEGRGEMVWFHKGHREPDEIFASIKDTMNLHSGNRRYAGEWKNGRRHGYGVHKLNIFHHEDGRWENDRFVGVE